MKKRISESSIRAAFQWVHWDCHPHCNPEAKMVLWAQQYFCRLKQNRNAGVGRSWEVDGWCCSQSSNLPSMEKSRTTYSCAVRNLIVLCNETFLTTKVVRFRPTKYLTFSMTLIKFWWDTLFPCWKIEYVISHMIIRWMHQSKERFPLETSISFI